MTIKAEIRSSPARMPQKNLDRGPDGFRHGQDPKSEDSCTFSAPPTSLRRVPGNPRAAPGSCRAVARQWPGRRKTLKKWGQLYVFSTCMTIKAEIRSSPTRMPRKNPDRGRDGFRHGQDPKSEDSCTFSVPPHQSHPGPRQRPSRSAAAPGSCLAVAGQKPGRRKPLKSGHSCTFSVHA